jgi:BirA family biotin operon repressor/biotin-[acetyl-CoA-carboxylase] ligase
MLAASAPLEVFDDIDSTILEARRRAERGDAGPVWLVARRQSAGRGRRGRAWESIDGNLFATYLGRVSAPPAEIALLGFATGLAIAEACDAVIGPGRARLKWPNDVFIDGAKASGLMLDSGGIGQGASWVAIGFGVNLVGAPQHLDQPATALRDHLPPDAPAPDPIAFLAMVRPRLEHWGHVLAHEGFAPLRKAWMTRAYGLGMTARVSIGADMLSGVLIGINESGELELDTAEGRRLIAAGDILFTPPSATSP